MARKNDIKMYSTHIEEKSVATKKFIRTLKNKKNMYIDKSDDKVN